VLGGHLEQADVLLLQLLLPLVRYLRHKVKHTAPGAVEGELAREVVLAAQLARDGGQITITARVIGTVPARMDVQLVRFIPDETVVIERGENAGRTIRYSNIVHDWSVLGSWDGRAPLSMSAAVDGPVAVIVQSPGPGSVMASAILR